MSKVQRPVDFNKVQWADYYYQNQDGDKSKYLPELPSVHMVSIKPNEFARAHKDYPQETNLERAKRLGVLDEWYPVCVLVVTANRHLRYTGTAAKKIWKAYNAHIYGSK